MSVSISHRVNPSRQVADSKLQRTVYDWVSDSSGNASLTTRVSGFLWRVTFVPGSGGSQPSANYDLVLTDEAGVDLLNGAGANLSNSAASTIFPTVGSCPIAVNDDLTLTISNAGNAKSGQVILHTR